MNTPHIPRGVINNNPFNIRRVDSTVWKGQEQTQADPSFVQFVTAEYGIRAGVRILMSYKRDGINTIERVIDRFAPPTENNTTAYVADVCARCGVDKDIVVDLDAIMAPLAKAIMHHENGGDFYTDEQVDTGIALASK